MTRKQYERYIDKYGMTAQKACKVYSVKRSDLFIYCIRIKVGRKNIWFNRNGEFTTYNERTAWRYVKRKHDDQTKQGII